MPFEARSFQVGDWVEIAPNTSYGISRPGSVGCIREIRGEIYKLNWVYLPYIRDRYFLYKSNSHITNLPELSLPAHWESDRNYRITQDDADRFDIYEADLIPASLENINFGESVQRGIIPHEWNITQADIDDWTREHPPIIRRENSETVEDRTIETVMDVIIR